MWREPNPCRAFTSNGNETSSGTPFGSHVGGDAMPRSSNRTCARYLSPSRSTISAAGSNTVAPSCSRDSARITWSRSVRGTTRRTSCSSTSARSAGRYSCSSIRGTSARCVARYSAGASAFASVATVVAPARLNASTMSTRCPAHVKSTAVTRSVQQERQGNDRRGGEDCGDDDARAPGQPVEREAEGEGPGRCGREHVARLQHVAVRGGIADREVEVAQQAEARQQRHGEPRRRTQGAAEQQQPAGDRKQRREQAEEALALAAAAPDAEENAPDVAVPRRDRPVQKVRTDRIGQHVGQAEADVERRRAPLPYRLTLRRAVEDRVAVLDRLPDVPGRRHDRRRQHDDGELPPRTGDGEGDDDRCERPQREGADELREPERDSGCGR